MADYAEQQSAAFNQLSVLLILGSFMYLLVWWLNRDRKNAFFEKDTGADDTDITAE